MATKKKLLQAAAGTAAAGGAGALNVEDVFSTYLYEGNEESQSIDNGINLGQSNDGGSAHFKPDNSNDTDGISLASADYITSGDFTIECFVWIEGLNSTNTYGYEIPTIFYFNSPRLSLTYDFVSPGGSADQAFNLFDTTYRFGSINQHPEGTYTNTWVHVAVVRNSGTIRCYVDGTEAFNFSNTTDYSGATLTIGNNSNGTPVQGHISNFRVVDGTAVYTSSFTPPTSELTAISGTTLLTFTSENTLTDTSSNSHAFTITGSVSASAFGPFDAADAGEGGMAWVKARTNGTYDHYIMDTERGVLKYLKPNGTSAQASSSNAITYFNSKGFTIGGGGQLNNGGDDYASWTFRKAPKFFDVVTYTGDGVAGRTVSHNLGSVPGCIFVKLTSGSDGWAVYHRGVDSSAPEDYRLVLNGTNARIDNTDGSRWNRTAPTSSVFSLGTDGSVNANGATYVAYLFAHNDGDGEFGPDGDQDIIKCGSCAGAGVTVDLGFEPQLLITKAYDTSSNWHIQDNMRTFDEVLQPHSSAAEVTDSTNLPKITSTGFEVPSSFLTSSNMIYIAIRRGPMAVPTDATDVYNTVQFDFDDFTEAGFPVDMVLSKQITSSSNTWRIADRLRPRYTLNPASSGAETLENYFWRFDNSTGIDNVVGGSVPDFQNWMLRRAPSFLDIVAYTGNGTAGRTISHNLGVAPEMIWIKKRNAVAQWVVYHSAITADKFMHLDSTDGANSGGSVIWNGTEPTSSVFTVGNNDINNVSSGTYIAYLFASLDGVSKVGSYTGDGTTDGSNVVDCGFSSGARFILVKRYDVSGGNWGVFDTERGITSGSDPRLFLSTTDAETTGIDFLVPTSSGFAFKAGFNTSGASYIFYAIA